MSFLGEGDLDSISKAIVTAAVCRGSVSIFWRKKEHSRSVSLSSELEASLNARFNLKCSHFQLRHSTLPSDIFQKPTTSTNRPINSKWMNWSSQQGYRAPNTFQSSLADVNVVLLEGVEQCREETLFALVDLIQTQCISRSLGNVTQIERMGEVFVPVIILPLQSSQCRRHLGESRVERKVTSAMANLLNHCMVSTFLSEECSPPKRTESKQRIRKNALKMEEISVVVTKSLSKIEEKEEMEEKEEEMQERSQQKHRIKDAKAIPSDVANKTNQTLDMKRLKEIPFSSAQAASEKTHQADISLRKDLEKTVTVSIEYIRSLRDKFHTIYIHNTLRTYINDVISVLRSLAITFSDCRQVIEGVEGFSTNLHRETALAHSLPTSLKNHTNSRETKVFDQWHERPSIKMIHALQDRPTTRSYSNVVSTAIALTLMDKESSNFVSPSHVRQAIMLTLPHRILGINKQVIEHTCNIQEQPLSQNVLPQPTFDPYHMSTNMKSLESEDIWSDSGFSQDPSLDSSKSSKAALHKSKNLPKQATTQPKSEASLSIENDCVCWSCLSKTMGNVEMLLLHVLRSTPALI